MKIKCIGPCGLEKDESEFYFRKDSGKYRAKCKICWNEQSKKYSADHEEDLKIYRNERYEENKEEILLKQKEYRNSHKEELSEYFKEYHIEHKEEKNGYNRQYYKKNKTKLNEQNKIYAAEHKEEIAVKSKIYREENKEKRRKTRNKWKKQKRKNNSAFRVSESISARINRDLKLAGSSKNGSSIWEHLPYNKEQLKSHIESTWSLPENLDENGNVWMSWENYGLANSKKKTWQIDHKKPQSHPDCQYTSMSDLKFLECWKLDNLQAMESFANIKKSNKYNG